MGSVILPSVGGSHGCNLAPHLTSDYVRCWRGCFRFSVSHRHRITRSSLLDCSHTEALVCSRAKLPKSAPFFKHKDCVSHDTRHLNVMITGKCQDQQQFNICTFSTLFHVHGFKAIFCCHLNFYVKLVEGSIKMNQEGSSNEKWCPVDKWTTTLGTDYNVPASQTHSTKQCIVNLMFYMSKLKVKVTRGG